MTKKRVNVTIDSDLVDIDCNYSEVLNKALRAISDTNLQCSEYAMNEKTITSHLEEIEKSLSRVNKLIASAQAQLDVFVPRKEQLLKDRVLYEAKLAENRLHYAEKEDTERKLELTFEINNAIRACNFIEADINTAVKRQLKEMKKLVPSFSLEKQIKIVRDWN